MKRVLMVFVVMLFVSSASVLAGDLSQSQQKLLQDNGIAVYPGSSYTTGDNEVANVMWFKSMDPVGKIIDWYKDNLSGWSEITVNNSRVIYKGTGVTEAKDLSSRPYIFARAKTEDPGSKDSEITVRIPK